MYILFPAEPFSPHKIDPSFEVESEAARTIGFDVALYDHDALTDAAERTRSAVARGIPHAASGPAILRGWMMTPEQYAYLGSSACSGERDVRLVTSAEEYERAHYIPGWYPHAEKLAARTAWVEGDDADVAWDLYQEFRGSDAVIKDWVKSAKYRWHDACFIPAGTGEARFREIFAIFREERGRLFNRGVVLREFVPFRERGGKVADLPIIEEYRLFFWRGELLAAAPGAPVDRPEWRRVASSLASRFVSVDVAQRDDGRWMVVECGDGGVSGLPESLDPTTFYAALWNHSRSA